jgi:hypothetical protein
MRVRVSTAVEPGTELGRLTFKLTFPKLFGYVRAEAGDPLKGDIAEVKVEPVKTAGAPDEASVQIEVLPAKGAKTIPGGAFANLVFKIPDEAKPGEVQMTASDVQAWGPSPAAATVMAAAGPAAKITIAEGGLPIFNCFFYMH